jgi:hypothetical protein
MGDWIWLGAAAGVVVAAVAGAVVVNAVLGLVSGWRPKPKQRPPVQLVREPPPLDTPAVLGRIGPRGRR